jgi:hypothetical protein
MEAETQTIEANPQAVIDNMLELFHPQAAIEIRKAQEAVRRWLETRFAELGVRAGDVVKPTLNAYNESYGLGIQSFVVAVERDGEALGGDGEFSNPTIGVIAVGMVNNETEVAVKSFAVANGNTEALTILSPIRIGDSTTSLSKIRDEGDSVSVVGPESAHVVIEASTVETGEETTMEVTPGVYACAYVIN